MRVNAAAAASDGAPCEGAALVASSRNAVKACPANDGRAANPPQLAANADLATHGFDAAQARSASVELLRLRLHKAPQRASD